MIHKFKNNDKYYCLDVETGTVLELDSLTYQLLGEEDLIEPDGITGFDLEEVNEAYQELKELKEEGLIYSKALEDIKPIDNTGVKALCLHVAHDCNLRCTYCFASQGDFKGKRVLMPFEVAKKAIDFVVKSSGNRRNIEIDFFGGEPLMNLDVVKKTVDYARSLEEENNKHFRFTLTTNGLGLTPDVMNYLDETMDNIVLSHDGRPSVNDYTRKAINGGGSYEFITPKIVEMAKLREEQGKDYYVRGTYTGCNLDFSEDVLHLNSLGIKSISIEPVVTDENSEFGINKEDLPQLKKEYDKLAKLALDGEFRFFHFNLNLDQGPCLYKRLSGCGSGTDYLAITPEGDIYPCHQFVSNPDFKLGNLDEGLTNTKILEQFKQANLVNKIKCKSCWARYFCGGGCHANNFNFTKDLLEPYEISCELEKMRLEAAIMLASEQKI